MLSYYEKFKMKERINDHYTSLFRHQNQVRELEKRIQSDPHATAINNDLRSEIKEHRDHIKRLQKEIDTMEAQL